MKILNIVLKVLLGLNLLLPALGMLGIFPPPTAAMFSPNGWTFMSALMMSGYMLPAIGLTCLACLILLIMNRIALMAIILTPLTVNIVCFHLFVDGTFFNPAAIPAWILLILNAYFLWQSRKKYKGLW